MIINYTKLELSVIEDQENINMTTAPVVTTTVPQTTTTIEETTTSKTTTAEAKADKPGDVNGDGKITVSDAILLARVAAEDTSAKITDAGRLNGELDGVTGLSTGDVTELLKMIAGIK